MPRRGTILFQVGVGLRRERQRRNVQRPEAVRELALIGRPVAVVIVARAEVQRRPADGPLIADERVVRIQLVDAEQVSVRSVAKAADMRSPSARRGSRFAARRC